MTSNAANLSAANRTQVARAIVVQTYAHTILAQSSITVIQPNLKSLYEARLTAGLVKAREHAQNYLDVIQPQLLNNMTNISAYYSFHTSVPTSLPPGSTDREWLDVLGELLKSATQFKNESLGLVSILQTLSNELSSDALSFSKIVEDMHATVGGDQGILATNKQNLASIETSIKIAIGAIVIGALSIVGGSISIIVGVLASPTSSEAILAGAGILVAGVTEVTIEGRALTGYQNQKEALINEDAGLEAEVKEALSISTTYSTLTSSVNDALQAANAMQSAWSSLASGLESMITNLTSGLTSVDVVRTEFLEAANVVLPAVIQDTKVIKDQLTGVQVVTPTSAGTNPNAARSPLLFATSECKMPAVVAGPENGIGILSRAIINLQNSASTMTALTGLPPEAQKVQSESSAAILHAVEYITAIQSEITAFVQKATSELKSVQAMISAQQELATIKGAIQKLSSEAAILKEHVDKATPLVRDTLSQIIGHFSALSKLESDLTSQKITLSSQVDIARGEQEAAQKRNYFLLALAPLTLFGAPAVLAAAAVALGLSLKFKSEADGYQNQIDALNSQIASLNTMKSTCESLGTNLGDVITKITGVRHAVDFVANDILTLESNLTSQDSLTLFSFRVLAALKEVTDLNKDNNASPMPRALPPVTTHLSSLAAALAVPIQTDALTAAPTGPNPDDAGKAMNDANKKHVGQALLIQAYALSVKEQPLVNFSGNEHIKQFEVQINEGLATAQKHATEYLDVIQPDIIKNIAEISNYYALHNAIPDTLPEGSTEAQWLEVLNALQTAAVQNADSSAKVASSLRTLRNNLAADSASFSKTVDDLNTAVNGDNGVLSSNLEQLSSIQKNIDGEIAGMVVSGLTIIGGAFLIAVGGIADFVTAGTSNWIVAGGVAVVAIGAGGEAAASLAFKSFNDAKAKLLIEDSKLSAEVNLALGISAGYQSLRNNVNDSITAADAMQNAWLLLKNDLQKMSDDLAGGISKTNILRKFFLDASARALKTVVADTETIKLQIAGLTSIVAKKGETVGDAIVAAVAKP